jgi:FAD/FMN-containing dehydrogenase
MARDLVLGLEVVLPDGQIWDGLRGLRKDNTGYDIKHLFVGGEGTLGIITAAVLKLFPHPRDVRTALVAVSGLDEALDLLVMAREVSGDRVTAFELMSRRVIEFVTAHVPGTQDPLEQAYDQYVLIELSSADAEAGLGAVLDRLLERAFDKGLIVDGTVAASDAQAQGLWKLREAASEAQKPEGGSIKHDVSVPVSRVPEFIRRGTALVEETIPGARVVAFGHVGDGNVHFNVSQPVGADREAFLAQWERLNRVVHDLVYEMNGSFSAEHGVGRMKRDDLARYRPAVELDLMRRIKAAIDPQNILNPGKVL